MGTFFHRHPRLTPYLLLAPGLAWLGLFFVIPLVFLGYQSLQSGVFPNFEFTWEFSNFTDAFAEYREQFFRSFLYAGIATVVSLLLAYPLVYWIAFRSGPWRNLFLLAIVAPFFVTYLIRTLAWLNILADEGPVVGFLQDIHVLDDGQGLLFTTLAVVAGITYNFFPFMALPLYVSLEQIDARLLEAAKDLYASPTQAFLRVTLPLSAPGIVAGTLLTFIPATGDFINAELLGTPKQQMIGNVIQGKFLESLDYPTAAALSFVLMATDPRRAPRVRQARRDGEAHRLTAFRRDGSPAPDVGNSRHLVPGDRQASPAHGLRAPRRRLPDAADRGGDPVLVQQARRPLQLRLAGVHVRQLGRMGRRPRIRESVIKSLQIGVLATVVATVLGTLIALAIVRHQFRGRGATNILVFLPMSTPEIVLGASLLTLFLNMTSFFTLGFWTIFIAHVMFIVSYIVVTVKARLIGFDRHLEEAAMDLGANEWTTFRKITLPLLAPAIVAASLLGFALSIDDFVITYFNAGGDRRSPSSSGASRASPCRPR